MNLTLLAPDIQWEILLLWPMTQRRDPPKEWQERPIVAEAVWAEQRKTWQKARS